MDTWQYLETFLVVTAWERVQLPLAGRGQASSRPGSAKDPTMPKLALTTRNYAIQNVNSVRLRNCSRLWNTTVNKEEKEIIAPLEPAVQC